MKKKIEIKDKSLKIRSRVNYRNTKWKTILPSIERVECRKVYDLNLDTYSDRRILSFVCKQGRNFGDEKIFELEFDVLDLINVMDCVTGRTSHDYEQMIVKQRDDSVKPKKKSRLKRK